ncbi:hypothetical protein B566_EDAN001889 [Ephemera danica]|nr:hypothetical protein B566_EDAN001889 [Ephemera danica]
MSFPDKETRAKCWEARDKYWACLNEVEKSGKKLEECQALQKVYQSNCPGQWVKHFDRKRQYEKFKERLEKEGNDPLLKK